MSWVYNSPRLILGSTLLVFFISSAELFFLVLIHACSKISSDCGQLQGFLSFIHDCVLRSRKKSSMTFKVDCFTIKKESTYYILLLHYQNLLWNIWKIFKFCYFVTSSIRRLTYRSFAEILFLCFNILWILLNRNLSLKIKNSYPFEVIRYFDRL